MNIEIPGLDSLRVPLKFGFGVAFVFSILINVLHMISPSDIETGQWASYVSVLFLWIGIYLGVLEKDRTSYDGRMSYLNGLKTSMLITIVATFLMGFFIFIYSEFINPELVDIIADAAKSEMRDNGITEAEIYRTLKPIYYHYSTTTQVKNMLMIGILGGSLFAIFAPLLKGKNRGDGKYASSKKF